MGTALGIGIGIPFQNASDAVDAYLVNDLSPDLVADFAGVLNSNTPYYRQGGATAAFTDFLTHSRSSNATMIDSDGVLKWAPHNLCGHSAALGSWSTGGSASVSSNDATDPDGGATADTVTFSTGTDSVFRASVFTAPAGVQVTFAAWARSDTVTSLLMGFNGVTKTTNNVASTAKTISSAWTLVTVDFTVVSSDTGLYSIFGFNAAGGGGSQEAGDVELWGAHVYRSDLGGMVDNPDRGDSYVPTTSAARYLARRNHHRWNGSAWVNKGILVESEARTQLLHTTNALVTQSHTVTAVPHTLHFTGTGTVTLSGASTAGPLVGTGTGENNRVSLTFTPSAASLTLTVSGTVTNAQLEIGSTPSSYIPNTAGSGTVTRAAETLTIAGADMPYSATAMSFQIQGETTYADTNSATQVGFFNWYAASNQTISMRLRTDTSGGAATGQVNLQRRSPSDSLLSMISSATAYSPGQNVPYNLAMRVTATDTNYAIEGTAATADTSASAIPVLSGTAFEIGGVSAAGTFSYMGTISLLRAWDADLTDAGIEEASA